MMSCKEFTNTENAAGFAGAGPAGATRRESRCLPQAGRWPDYEVTALLKRCPVAKVRSPGYNQHAGGAGVPVMFQSREMENPGELDGGKPGMDWPEFPPKKAAKPRTWTAALSLERKFSSSRDAAGLPGTDTRQFAPGAGMTKEVDCDCEFAKVREIGLDTRLRGNDKRVGHGKNRGRGLLKNTSTSL